jgi:hypothetical protein
MDKDLETTAQKIQHAEVTHSGPVPLNQPHPEEFEHSSDTQLSEYEHQDAPVASQNNQSSQQPPMPSAPTDTDASRPSLSQPADKTAQDQPSVSEIQHTPSKSYTLPITIIGAVFVILGVIIMVIGSTIFGIIMALVGIGIIILSVIAPAKA